MKTDLAPWASQPLRTGLRGFFDGVAAPLAGYRFIRSQPGLGRYTVAPAAIHFVLTAAALTGFAFLARGAFARIDAWLPGGWLWGALELVLDAGVVLLILLATGAVSVIAGAVLCSVFYERLAREVELLLGVAPGELRDVSLVASVVDSLRHFVEIAIVAACALLLSLVPLLGAIVPWISFFWSAFLFGLEYLDYPLALRGMRRAEKRAFARRHRAAVTGLGTVVFLFNVVPIIGPLFLAPAVVGGIFLRRRAHAAPR